MSTRTPEPAAPSRLERALAYATLIVVVGAVIAYIVTMIVGMNDREALAGGLWQIVVWISYIGLPIGFVLLIGLLTLSMRRRSAANRASGKQR